MTQRLAHRGPDDVGLFSDEAARIGLGHRRLSIIDLAPSGHQPMDDASGRYCVVFNGEIYNYRELRQELTASGHQFRGTSDTEVLVELYARSQLDCLDRLNGIFAFAIWDRAERHLTLVRDPLGVKPLYWTQTARGVLFASELKSLLLSKDLDRSLDQQALACYLTYLWAPAPLTPLRAVRKLLPGHALTIADGRIVAEREYFRLPAPAPVPGGVGDALGRLEAALENSVRRQLVADVPVGAFLSGGLDSSTIVALARKHSPTPLQCFTITYDDDHGADGMEADLPYARRVARLLDVPLQEVRVTPAIASDLPWMVQQLDEPQADPACLNAWYICRTARERGYKVLLSGAGGDDLLTGYRRHFAIRSERFWSWLPAPARQLMSAAAGALPARDRRLRRLAKALRYAAYEPAERLVSYFYWSDPGEVRRLLRSDVSPETPLLQTLAARSDVRTPLDRMLLLECQYFLADHNLAYTDKMSMAAGVEVRVPLIDLEMVRCAAGIPLGMKQRGRDGKWILKQFMSRYLPQDIIYRPKTGFGVPLRSWIRGPLAPLLDEHLSAGGADRGLMDPQVLAQWRLQNERGAADYAYPLLAALCVQLWTDSLRATPAVL